MYICIYCRGRLAKRVTPSGLPLDILFTDVLTLPCQHRPIRHCRNGHDGVYPAAAARRHGAATQGSRNKAYTRVAGCRGHRQVHIRSRTGGLSSRRVY